ncbi:hypothetical protein EJB05_41188, partial [Eragrostis curvula]
MAASRALVLIFGLCCCTSALSSSAASDDFLRCLTANVPNQLLYTQNSPSFTSVLVSSLRNSKFSAPTTVRPLCIVTPTNASHVQAAVLCGRRHGVRLRVRSGGHDYEGLSYRSERPEMFAVVDLANLRAVRVNHRAATAWVDSGATVGELSNLREAYFNYRDLYLGQNIVVGNVSSYEAGKVWGQKYFKDNYKRLAIAKGKIDPDDYFRNEQSIPPLLHTK